MWRSWGPAILLEFSFVLYLSCALLIDSRTLPQGRFADRPAWSIALAVLTLSLLFAIWFALSWRPVYAAIAALTHFLIVSQISDYKYRNVQEPLSFVDFALIPQIWRHPGLYQAQFLRHPLFYAVVALLVALTAVWFIYLEPSMLPARHRLVWYVSGVVVVASLLGWFIAGPLPTWLVGGVYRRMIPADAARYVREIGFAASLSAGLIAWRHAPSGSHQWPRQPPISTDAKLSPVVIVVQSESFVDLNRAGVHSEVLPAFRAAQARSLAHGCVGVPVQGAWTLRSEFVFLTGRALDSIGIDALHPYLRLRHPPRSIAHLMRDAGFATVFAHPFDMDFFNRSSALPLLGFDRLIDETAFAGIAREGYYVPDAALAERVLTMAAEATQPFFCMTATMENHNPWDKHRLPGIATPAERYMYHLRNADRMIAQLIEGLERLGRPAVLAFYGDHVPTMPSLADPFPDPRTDYFVMALRDGTWLTGQRRDLDLHQLADVVLAALEKVCPPRDVQTGMSAEANAVNGGGG
jgi:hypothetical protein